MKKINWNNIEYFTQGEFSENPIYAEPRLIYNLDSIRAKINERIYPSPVKGALARFSGDNETQHYAVGRRSTAIDVFCEGYPLMNFLTILSLKKFNGIGIYLDTNGPDGTSWIMFHLDIRKKGFTEDAPLIWFATKTHNKNNYFYPQFQPQYWKLMCYDILFAKRTKLKKTPTIG